METCEEQRRKLEQLARQNDTIMGKKLIDSLVVSLKLTGIASETGILAEFSQKVIQLDRDKDALEAALEVGYFMLLQ